jgi:preprotein translocase subunit SecG
VLAGDRERLLVALADLLCGDSLLEPVVSGQEQVVDLLPGLVGVHRGIMLERAPPGSGSSPEPGVGYPTAAMLPVSAVVQVLLSVALIGLILMHSGRDAGLGGMGFTPASQGGTHIVERNLTRVTAVVAILFFANSIILFRLLK